MGMFVSINSVNLLMVLAITFLASSSAFVGHMGSRRNYRLTCLGAGEGFGSKKEPANEFPSIDAFAKDNRGGTPVSHARIGAAGGPSPEIEDLLIDASESIEGIKVEPAADRDISSALPLEGDPGA